VLCVRRVVGPGAPSLAHCAIGPAQAAGRGVPAWLLVIRRDSAPARAVRAAATADAPGGSLSTTPSGTARGGAALAAVTATSGWFMRLRRRLSVHGGDSMGTPRGASPVRESDTTTAAIISSGVAPRGELAGSAPSAAGGGHAADGPAGGGHPLLLVVFRDTVDGEIVATGGAGHTTRVDLRGSAAGTPAFGTRVTCATLAEMAARALRRAAASVDAVTGASAASHCGGGSASAGDVAPAKHLFCAPLPAGNDAAPEPAVASLPEQVCVRVPGDTCLHCSVVFPVSGDTDFAARVRAAGQHASKCAFSMCAFNVCMSVFAPAPFACVCL
jgi:hypothetical protein